MSMRTSHWSVAPRVSRKVLYTGAYSDFLAAAPPEPRAEAAVVGGAGGPSCSSEVGLYDHAVGPRDTLMGLALAYGSSVAELRQLNALPTENIAGLRVLRVPAGRPNARIAVVPGAAEASAAVAAREFFAAATGLRGAEARYYLDEAGGNADAAVAAWRADEAATPGGAAAADAAAAAAVLASVRVSASDGAPAERSSQAISRSVETARGVGNAAALHPAVGASETGDDDDASNQSSGLLARSTSALRRRRGDAGK